MYKTISANIFDDNDYMKEGIRKGMSRGASYISRAGNMKRGPSLVKAPSRKSR
jgi:hypothetical protein